MASLRILLVLVTVLATSLSGAVAATHGGPAQGDGMHHASMMPDAGDAQPACCDAGADRSGPCPMVLAIEPSVPAATARRARERQPGPGAAWTLSGDAPSGLLDPPRRA